MRSTADHWSAFEVAIQDVIINLCRAASLTALRRNEWATVCPRRRPHQPGCTDVSLVEQTITCIFMLRATTTALSDDTCSKPLTAGTFL